MNVFRAIFAYCALFLGVAGVSAASIANLEKSLKDKNVKAFLDVIAYAEGTYGKGEYHARFAAPRMVHLKSHPTGDIRCQKIGAKEWCSDASGRYMFLGKTWKTVQKRLGLSDFGPHNQDIAALYLIWERGAIPVIKAGKIAEAIRLTNGIWATFPGSKFGQPVQRLSDLERFYRKKVSV